VVFEGGIKLREIGQTPGSFGTNSDGRLIQRVVPNVWRQDWQRSNGKQSCKITKPGCWDYTVKAPLSAVRRAARDVGVVPEEGRKRAVEEYLRRRRSEWWVKKKDTSAEFEQVLTITFPSPIREIVI